MTKLVVYYSRSGHTKQIGDIIVKAISGDVEELIDTANRKGSVGFVKSIFDGGGRKLANIESAKIDPSKYDIVIIGTPNWDANISSPVRTYLTNSKEKLRNVAFFCTEGVRGGSEKAFAEMAKVCGKKPKATLTVSLHDFNNGNYSDKVNRFIDEINA